jgi:Arc/MetJ-type ribon-helix-helix transcriptional regulator
MIKIRVSLPLSYIQKADEYVKKGVYSSKNDLIRDAVHQLLLEFEKLEIGKKSPYKGSPLYQSLQGNSRI